MIPDSGATLSPFGYGILIGVLTLALSAGGILVAWLLWRQQRHNQALAKGLVELQGALDNAVQGATQQERRIERLEERQRGLEQRLDKGLGPRVLSLQQQLEELAGNQRAARPYDEAIRLVRQGAKAERLMEELGLSSSEADLLIMLHGQGKSHPAR
jgi:hypothetical protein